MRHDVKPSEIASGKWNWILTHFGVPDRYLTGKHGPCPFCMDGKDRYRFDNKEGRGTFICNQCGNGDGYEFLQRFKGWSFKDAFREVIAIAGTVQAEPIKSETEEAKKKAAVKRIWEDSIEVTEGDPVWKYLNRRIGLKEVPGAIRFHPALPYVDGDSMDYHPAMVAVVTSHENRGVGVHRIYLNEDGFKANVEKPKKLFAANALQGASVKLGRANEVLGIAEGIETALAASMAFSVPVWSAVSAGMLEQWNPPESVRRVIVFGDNDASYTGQASAYVLAKKLTNKGLSVDVRIPDKVGEDWLDAIRG